ncbi:hypothetical protein HYC85_024026 [Camellia sinensis]|uniref:Plant bHLH transcription factor ACT-like domain-containing protein n=1 Tax=Camellia sinensis TaxID=4442 RepID=A0A7J7GGZ7_CAMSI|nr:hypothetical protein HYC85_024026 [Camellia sinensis]
MWGPWAACAGLGPHVQEMRPHVRKIGEVLGWSLQYMQVNKTSIIVDASKYIEELKGKVERLSQDVASSQSSNGQNSLPMQVTVETLEKGFLINVFSEEKKCPGLLVTILKAFEELGLDVLDANVSCSDNFRLEAVGGELLRSGHNRRTITVCAVDNAQLGHGDRIDDFEPLWSASAARPWDPPLVDASLVRAFCTGRKFRTQLGFSIYRVFVSHRFLRRYQEGLSSSRSQVSSRR